MTPPTFLLQAEDDHVDSVYDSLAYYIALKRAGVSAEMHLYPSGGHALRSPYNRKRYHALDGIGRSTWLLTIGMVPHSISLHKSHK